MIDIAELMRLTTAFSGVQLAVVGALIWQSRETQKTLAATVRTVNKLRDTMNHLLGKLGHPPINHVEEGD